MNRRLFLSKIALTVGAIALAPAINLLDEPKTICNNDLWKVLTSTPSKFYDKQLLDSMSNVDRVMAEMWTDLVTFNETGLVKITEERVEYTPFLEANKFVIE